MSGGLQDILNKVDLNAFQMHIHAHHPHVLACPRSKVEGILHHPQATSSDRDFRYMACSDLLTLLQAEGTRIDHDMEQKLSTIMLQHMDDTAGDISSLAIRWYAHRLHRRPHLRHYTLHSLALLVMRSADSNVITVVQTLGQRVRT